jgi:pyrroline-5-carboxylate reductase
MIQIGAGSMGGALLKAWLESGVVDPARSAVIDPRPSPDLEAMCEARGLTINPEEDGAYDICVLGVKPQQFASILPELSWQNFGDTLFLSIAAGITVQEIEALLKSRAPQPRVLRVMPTLPAKVRRGVSLLAENPALSETDRERGEAMMKAAGDTYWCDDEDQLNRLMGVTGCAPAFLLRAVEGLAAAAEAQGASPEDARRMAETTFTATARLLEEDGRSAGDLREAVTSPGGTTAAGLDVLNERGLVESFVDAVQNAYNRALELAGGGKG